MSSEVVIRVQNLSKAYPVFEKPFHRMLQLLAPSGSQRAGDFQALSDVSFEVHRGEALGIIGRNGSGKSTMLQVVSGTLQPTSGAVEVGGRVAALLELGAGFNPEFSGLENVYLNGSILGLSRKDIEARLPEILAFAEIGDHVRQPVKTYSSGMFVRLAFAVAAHCDPDILIVDEALAVGDVYFQRKCYRRIEELRNGGCTLLLVTHSMDSLLQLCDRAVVLEGGRKVFDGDCRPAVAEYMRCLFGQHLGADANGGTRVPAEEQAEAGADRDEPRALLMGGGHEDLFASRAGYNRSETRLGDGRAVLGDFLVRSSLGQGPVLRAREDFSIFARYGFLESIDRLAFGLQVRTVDGLIVYSTNTLVSTGILVACSEGEVRVAEFRLKCTLLPGQYFVSLGISRFEDGIDEVLAIDRRVDAIILSVIGGNDHTNGFADMQAEISFDAPAGGEGVE